MDTFMMLVFSVRRGESSEAKSATTVLVYARSVVHSHAEVGIDISFLLPSILSLHKGLVKNPTVDLPN